MIPDYLMQIVKQYLGWDDDTNDGWLEATLTMIVGAAQTRTGVMFLPTRVEEIFRPHPRGCGCCNGGCPPVALEFWPVLTLETVDVDGTVQDVTQYWISPFGHVFKNEVPVPVQGRRMTFTYVSGFDPLPPDVILAICAAVGNMATAQGLTSDAMGANAKKISIVDVGSIDLGDSGFNTGSGDPIFGGYGEIFDNYARPQIGGHPCSEWSVKGFAESVTQAGGP